MLLLTSEALAWSFLYDQRNLSNAMPKKVTPASIKVIRYYDLSTKCQNVNQEYFDLHIKIKLSDIILCLQRPDPSRNR